MGRPPKPAGQARDWVVHTRLTPAEKLLLEDLAAAEEVLPAELLRRALAHYSKRPAGKRSRRRSPAGRSV